MTRTRMLIATVLVIAVAGTAYIVGRGSRPPVETPTPETASQTEEDPAILELGADQVIAARIELVRPELAQLATLIVAPGSVSSRPGAEAVLTAHADGSIVQVLKGIGDPVRVGETIALIESREASSIVADIEVAKAQVELVRARYLREERLYQAGATSLQIYEIARTDLAAAEAELRRSEAAAIAAGVTDDGRTIKVSSPTAGRISEAPAMLGAFVTAGMPLYRIVDPTRVEIRVSVPASDADLIASGDEVSVEVLGGGSMSTTVHSVSPDADPASRSATIVLAPAGDTERLRPGQAVRATFDVRKENADSRLTLPTEAVQFLEGEDVVFVRTPDGFRVQPVTTGARTAERIEVLAGTGPEDEVAGQNAFLLKAEMSKGEEEEGE